MGALSPTLTDAFRLLRTDLHLHLDAAESLASKTDEWSHQDVDVARKLLLGPVATAGPTVGMASPAVTTIHAQVKDSDRELVAITVRAHAACPVTHGQRRRWLHLRADRPGSP